MPVLGVFGRLLTASASFEALPPDAAAFINPTFSPFCPSTYGFRFENPQSQTSQFIQTSEGEEKPKRIFWQSVFPIRVKSQVIIALNVTRISSCQM